MQKHPECYEAWANRGYALLMMYCDQLDETSLRDRALGQLVVGGYYRRADSLGVRGPAHETWVAAVEALRKALSLQPELVVARANLAAAYLLAPEGAAETAS
ncbi:MAG TPA: hypothetical protein PJ982_08280, partial [Lacipirellulaceae bacterium]|nr:hypothetical protein [Lacipirellulaceae bacterium]